jgi:hypothetical protein
MQPLNRFQFFRGIMNSSDEVIEIDVISFNQFARKIKGYGFICDFEYEDLENYAYSLSESSREIKDSNLKLFKGQWTKRIEFFAEYYDNLSTNYDKIIEVWQEVVLK